MKPILCIIGIHRHHTMAAREIPSRECPRHGYDCNHTTKLHKAIVYTCADCGREWIGMTAFYA